jgi:uncharacterized membrane protein
MIDLWLFLPLPALIAVIALFYSAIAVLLVQFSFGRGIAGAMQSFNSVVAPFIAMVVIIFAILIGFLANDIWDRDRGAATVVRTETDQLLALNTLVTTFDLPRDAIAPAIRSYASTVVNKEWPSMERQQTSPEA